MSMWAVKIPLQDAGVETLVKRSEAGSWLFYIPITLILQDFSSAS